MLHILKMIMLSMLLVTMLYSNEAKVFEVYDKCDRILQKEEVDSEDYLTLFPSLSCKELIDKYEPTYNGDWTTAVYPYLKTLDLKSGNAMREYVKSKVVKDKDEPTETEVSTVIYKCSNVMQLVMVEKLRLYHKQQYNELNTKFLSDSVEDKDYILDNFLNPASEYVFQSCVGNEISKEEDYTIEKIFKLDK